MTEQELENELTRITLFSVLTYPALRRIVRNGRLLQAREGQFVLGPGFGGTGFFVILEGFIAITMNDGPLVSYLTRGDVFGETALLEGVERTAICRAYSDCLLFEVPFGSFHADLAVNPAWRTAVDQISRRRQSINLAIRKGAPPPDLTPPDKPVAPEVEATAAQDADGNEPEAMPASDEKPQPPAVYATA